MISLRLFNYEAAFRQLTVAGSNTAVRSYSMIARTYAQPIINKEEQEPLLEEKNRYKLPKFVRPALATDTSSDFFEEPIRKFTNAIMREGNKILARQLINKTLWNIKVSQLKRYRATPDDKKQTIELDPKKILIEAIENCKPMLGTVQVRRGGINYTVPLPLKERRSNFLAMKFLIESGKQKGKDVRVTETLAKVIIEAFQNSGPAIQRKQQLHKICDENRAYAHYRWMGQGKSVH